MGSQTRSNYSSFTSHGEYPRVHSWLWCLPSMSLWDSLSKLMVLGRCSWESMCGYLCEVSFSMVTNLASSPEYFFKSCRSTGVLTVLKMSLRYESVVQVVYYTRNQTVDDKSTEERKKEPAACFLLFPNTREWIPLNYNGIFKSDIIKFNTWNYIFTRIKDYFKLRL